MTGYQFKKRPQIEDNQIKLKVNNLAEKYNVIHPSVVTLGADLYLLQKSGGSKDTAIPVHREFIITVIPFFAKQYSDDGIWREGKLKDLGDISISKLPETVNIKAVVAYIKSLYEIDYNPLSLATCLDILELADYWCDQFMKTECLNFIEEAMNDDLFEDIYENPRIQGLVGKIVKEYVRGDLKCYTCENNKFHVFQSKKKRTSAVLSKSNTAIHFKTEPGNVNNTFWDVFTTRSIPKNQSQQEIRLKFKVTNNDFRNVFVGIIDGNVKFQFSKKEPMSTITDQRYRFCGFRLNRYIDVDDMTETILRARTVFDLLPKSVDVPIVNDTKPFDRFLQNDVFTMIYSKTLLKLESDRGFKCCVELTRAPRVSFRFCVQVANNIDDESNDGNGLELLPDFDHVCEI